MRDVPQTYPWSLLVTFNNKCCLVFSQPAQIICLECRNLLLSGLGAVGRLLLGIMYLPTTVFPRLTGHLCPLHFRPV
jgi:hypothetical protein